MKTYNVNDIFLSPQGEGLRAGTLNVFVRFAACNQTCLVETHGFDCDTEFASHAKQSAEEIRERVLSLWTGGPGHNIIFTGGEPALQVDDELIDVLRPDAETLAIETNGSIDVSDLDLDWVCVSPKVAEHAVRQLTANEVKYVRNVGQGIPKPACVANHKLISPAFNGEHPVPGALDWCVKLIKENPEWRLTMQMHKVWKVR